MVKQALRSRRSRDRTVGVLAAVGTVAVAATVAVTIRTGSNRTIAAQRVPTGLPVVPGPIGPESVSVEQDPVLASVFPSAAGGTVDGLECNSSEQVAYQWHTHLSVYMNGMLRSRPVSVSLHR
jgi:hypothetical protein